MSVVDVEALSWTTSNVTLTQLSQILCKISIQATQKLSELSTGTVFYNTIYLDYLQYITQKSRVISNFIRISCHRSQYLQVDKSRVIGGNFMAHQVNLI